MKRQSLELLLEALRSARDELEALEADEDWYVTGGNLIEQLEEAEALIDEDLAR